MPGPSQNRSLAKLIERNRQLEAELLLLLAENSRLTALALSDSLTGLENRRAFEAEIARAVQQALRYGRQLSLVLIDLDGMKQVNDTLGHAAGDEALRAVAAVIRAEARGSDLAARLGGDEFAIVLPETSLEGAEVLAARIRSRVEEIRLQGWRIATSTGAAELTAEQDAAALFADADAALYQMKRSRGRRPSSTHHHPAYAEGAIP